MDEDDKKRFSYCGCDVLDGQLRILFREGYLGTNIYDAVATDNLLIALNEAPPPAGLRPTPGGSPEDCWSPVAPSR